MSKYITSGNEPIPENEESKYEQSEPSETCMAFCRRLGIIILICRGNFSGIF